jgi:hypothetical protein
MNLLEASQDHIGFVTQTRRSFAQFMVQVIQVMTAEVFHLNLFQIMPDALIRVQVGRIARQAFQMDASGGPLAGQTTPDDEQFAVPKVREPITNKRIADDVKAASSNRMQTLMSHITNCEDARGRMPVELPSLRTITIARTTAFRAPPKTFCLCFCVNGLIWDRVGATSYWPEIASLSCVMRAMLMDLSLVWFRRRRRGWSSF